MQQDMHDMKRRIAGAYKKNMNPRRRDKPTWGSLDKYLPKEGEDGPRETARSAPAGVPLHDMAKDDTSNESDSNVLGAQFPGHFGT